jgi:hypothetical protein
MRSRQTAKRRMCAADNPMAVACRRHLFSRTSVFRRAARKIDGHGGEGMLKAALMLVATPTAAAPAWGAWTALGEDDAKAVWYVDPESIRAEGGVRQVWAMKDMAQPGTDFDLLHALRGRLRGAAAPPGAVQSVKGRMGGSDPTRGGMVFGDWTTAGPGTVGSGITRAVCNRS